MTIPELTKSSRYESVDVVSTAMRFSSLLRFTSALIVFWLFRCGVIDLDVRFRFQRAQRLVASHHNLITLLLTFRHFNIRDAGDPCLHRPEYRFLAVHHKHALYFILFRIAWRWGRRRCQRHTRILLRVLRRLFQVLA